MKASDLPDEYDRLVRIDMLTGGIEHLDESSYGVAMQQTELNFHCALFDIAREEKSKVLYDIANDALSSESATKRLRAHAAAYLYRIFEEQPARRVLVDLQAELTTGLPKNEPEVMTIGFHYEDAHSFAGKILRESIESALD
ncbi:hypothetical protein CA85_01560 [Allorhodopirellula solitaria]|uniref:Uncharacterized protein n=2 Tax=Allorhodopirellula solitaria TaxID=2527987 RepID=A0A5C5YJ32_9BACT|nr:hypothetical protein CA85_01560 [Allorhodopirellula solitaria]